MLRYFLIILLLNLAVIQHLYSQANGSILSSWIERIAEVNQLKFYYNDEWFTNIEVPDHILQNNSLDQLVETLKLNGFKLIFFDPDYAIVVIDTDTRTNGIISYDDNGVISLIFVVQDFPGS